MSNWRTNFYYQQDLKSEEMNGIFNSSLTPGVYNADITITESTGASLFNVNVAAGTTLVFTNRLARKDNSYYRQFTDFANLVKDDYYTIKTTAKKDTIEGVLAVGNTYTLPDRFFLVAIMPYGEAGVTDPIFRLAGPNSNPNRDRGVLLKELNSSDSAYVLYDGINTDDFGRTVAYLVVGEFVRVGSQVATQTNGKLDFSQFTANYVFTRRGLEEYRYSYSSDRNTPSPDFSYTKDLNALKLYWSTFIANSILFRGTDLRSYYDEFIRSSTAESVRLASDPAITGNGVVYDFVFASFRDIYQDNYSLSTVMSDIAYPRTPVIYTCKWVQTTSSGLTPQSDFTLAESITPQSLLLDKIAGRPILARIATAIKKGEVTVYNASGAASAFSPEAVSAIIPIALIMRPFSNGVGTDKCSVGSTVRLNPEFVISYLDLYQGANECTSINLNLDNIYSTVAILN